MMLGRITRDDQLASGDREPDPDVIDATLMVVAVRRLDNHVAGDDVVGEPLELLGPSAQVVLQSRGCLEVAEGESQER